MSKRLLQIVVVMFLLILGCESKTYTPKPKAYPKIEFPDRAYQRYDSNTCPFTFEFPTYAELTLDEKRRIDEAEKCWFDVYFKTFDARLHLSYYDIQNAQHFSKLLDDAFVIADKINARSNFMDEMRVQNEFGVGGLLMDFAGRAASPMQFFLTDTTAHFLKAALYFNSKVVPDSIAPISEFVKADVAQMINTFQWK